MSTYVLGVFVHILAATVLVGGSLVAAPLMRTAVRRAGETQELQALLRFARSLSKVNPVSALIVLASGIYLATAAHFWRHGWVQVSAGLWLVNAIVAAAIVERAVHRVATAAGAAWQDGISAAVDSARWSKGWTVGGDMLAANDFAMLYLMVVRPSLLSSLVAALAINLFVLAVRQLLPRQPRRALRSPVGERTEVLMGG